MLLTDEARIIKESSHGYDFIRIQDEMLAHREVELVGEVDAGAVNALIRQFRYLQRQDPDGEITLYINSPGGVDSGLALYDVMQAIRCPIRTVCVGPPVYLRRPAGHAAPQPSDDPRPAHRPDRRQHPAA